MKSILKMASIILIMSMILTIFITYNNISFATQNISTDINAIDNSKYPGIQEKIKTLQSKYPNWKFKILYTGLNWDDVISHEYVGHGSSPKNLVQKYGNYKGAWICSICGDTAYDNGSWRCASEQAIKYMMDPRNSLNESDIFQFEETSYSETTATELKKMTQGTFLEGLEEKIINTSKQYNVSPFFVTARIIQEQGKSGSTLSKGQGYNGKYVGYYNLFNIAASGNTTEEIILNALAYAEKKGWNTIEKSIAGGITFLSDNYISNDQNTLYLQKFNVAGKKDLYSHQYMQNILVARSEGTKLRNAYININSLSNSHTFVIPVYENMPKSACSEPDSNGTSSTEIDLVKVNVDQTLRIRNSPNGTQTVGWLEKNEIVTRVEKATSKVAGTYWDKVRKANGVVGYAARETFESEANYKLYLVPVNENNTNTTTNNLKDTSTVKLDLSNKIIKVTPDAKAKDILDSNGGSIKITRADGNLLSGEQEKLGTGYIVDNKLIVVKLGDCNGDGVINSGDLLKVRKYLLGTDNEKNSFIIKSMDLNGDSKINSGDLLLLRKSLLGTYQIK